METTNTAARSEVETGAVIPAVRTRQLSRRFGKVLAVDDLNLEIHPGARYGLIGPNGAGKTTTLRMLAGLLEPTGGDIQINGIAASGDWHLLQRQIGYMPDFFGVYDDMLVWEYLDFFARCYDLESGRRQAVVDDLLELVDLAEKRDAYVQTLSRGMRQRLCLAHTLVHDPDILLLDEPASGLDPRARVEMRELLRELGAMGKTIIISSHILSELTELCDSVGIIENGQLVASGSVEHIRKLAHEGRTIQIKPLTAIDEVAAVLQELPAVSRITTSDGEIEAAFTGSDEEIAALLETLINRGVRMVSFSEATSDLEEIFLSLTQGELSG